eukprot:1240266-Ditylum_brightwellii.AAC.1
MRTRGVDRSDGMRNSLVGLGKIFTVGCATDKVEFERKCEHIVSRYLVANPPILRWLLAVFGSKEGVK